MRDTTSARFAVTLLALAAAACGGGVTSPTGASRDVGNQFCSYQLTPAVQQVGPAGGPQEVAVATGPGCTWTATTSISWISITRDSGSGSGTAAYMLEPNSTTQAREGRIQIGTGSSAETQVINQAGEPCTFEVEPSSQNVPDTGGTYEFTLKTRDTCTWPVTVSDTWVSLSTQNGTGSRIVSYTVSPNTNSASRTATIRVGDQTVRVNQIGRGDPPPPPPPPPSRPELPPDCTSITIGSGSLTVPNTGGTFAVSVNAPAGCPWTVTPSASWISASPTTGTGPSTVTITVSPNTDPERSGSVSFGSAALTINQPGVCTYSISLIDSSGGTLPGADLTIPASGGNASLSVRVGSACRWTVTTPPWITPSPREGTDSRVVALSVAAHEGPARSGTVQVGGQSINVSQPSGCKYSVSASSLGFSCVGGVEELSVTTTAPGCAWSAATHDSWISISPGSGSGTGTVAVRAASFTCGSIAMPDPFRRGKITVAGFPVSVVQGGRQ